VELAADRRCQLTPLGEPRGDEAARLMGRALHDDPLFVHACPDAGDRSRWLKATARLSCSSPSSRRTCHFMNATATG
jgi:hypothetical protein